jgi:hypothetical protein
MDKTQLHDLARVGAQARLAALETERQELLKLFPDLGGVQRKAGKNGAPAPAPKRGGMSPEARKAQAERMRAYWAARRAAKAQQGGEAPGKAASTKKRAGKKAR